LGSEINGLFFVFADSRPRYFWMKDMKFSLDAIWVENNQIVSLTENIQITSPSGEINRFASTVSADAVLEVPAGFITKNSLKIGDFVKLD